MNTMNLISEASSAICWLNVRYTTFGLVERLSGRRSPRKPMSVVSFSRQGTTTANLVSDEDESTLQQIKKD